MEEYSKIGITLIMESLFSISRQFFSHKYLLISKDSSIDIGKFFHKMIFKKLTKLGKKINLRSTGGEVENGFLLSIYNLLLN